MEIILGTMTFGNQTSQSEARDQIKLFLSQSHRRIDTARMYCHGLTEDILGEISHDPTLGIVDKIEFASKVNAFQGYNESLSSDSVKSQSDDILRALRVSSTEIFYLHAPDIHTPIEETLSTVQELYIQGRFKLFGLSNYAAWEVVYIHSYCSTRGWVIPSVYQGMYNAITRDVERELFPALRKLGMSFFCYNPLCGGLLTGKHSPDDPLSSKGTRFDETNILYRSRYWKEQYFRAIESLDMICVGQGESLRDCSLRWLIHHSSLSAAAGDGVIIGASSTTHLQANLASCEKGPLPLALVEAFDQAWAVTFPVCQKYFRP